MCEHDCVPENDESDVSLQWTTTDTKTPVFVNVSKNHQDQGFDKFEFSPTESCMKKFATKNHHIVTV